jgi:protein involved in polysaccharide export with SLBB domain
VNFVRRGYLFGPLHGLRCHAPIFAVLLSLISLSGCGDQVRPATQDELAAFEKVGSSAPVVDMDRVRQAKVQTGPYRVIPGDVLEFAMPSLLRSVTAAEVLTAQSQDQTNRPYICRVRADGTITLPAVESLAVAGLSLGQIEEKVAAAYASFSVREPSVFARVTEYSTSKVYVAGAVEKPGVYTLHADQMTLVSLLTEAGGIAKTGAAAVRVVRSKSSSDSTSASRSSSDTPIVLPVVGMNIPFEDVSLKEGDTVIVEQIHMPLFSVLGLVNKPGNIEYPPGVEYNLAQAIAFAGGFDDVADPRYATIYRINESGSITRVPLKLVDKDAFTEAMGTAIRPGDVVAIEHTPRTRANVAISRLLRINTGLYIQGSDLWGN